MTDFENRLLYIFEKFSLNASSFADKIGVQRSSMSHILSGRNKPSLDFILKVYNTFPEINLPWLALGEGDFLKSTTSPIENHNNNSIKNKDNNLSIYNSENKKSIVEIKPNRIEEQNQEIINRSGFTILENKKTKHTDNKLEDEKNNTLSSISKNDSDVEQIIFFYKDGTFKSFNSR